MSITLLVLLVSFLVETITGVRSRQIRYLPIRNLLWSFSTPSKKCEKIPKRLSQPAERHRSMYRMRESRDADISPLNVPTASLNSWTTLGCATPERTLKVRYNARPDTMRVLQEKISRSNLLLGGIDKGKTDRWTRRVRVAT